MSRLKIVEENERAEKKYVLEELGTLDVFCFTEVDGDLDGETCIVTPERTCSHTRVLNLVRGTFHERRNYAPVVRLDATLIIKKER